MAAPGDLVTLNAARTYLGITDFGSDAVLVPMISQISRAIYNYMNRSFVLPKPVSEFYDGFGGDTLLLRSWPVNSISSLIVNGVIIPAAPAMADGVSQWTPGYVLEQPDDEPPGAMQQIILRGCSYRFHKGRQNVAVSYVAGYLVSGEAQTVVAGADAVVAFQPYGQWGSDQGVTYANGTAMTLVASAPAQGQYATDGQGNYTFAAADAGQSVLISYGYIPADLTQCALEWVADRFRYKDRIGQSSKSLGGQETTSFKIVDVPGFVKTSLQNFCRILAN